MNVLAWNCKGINSDARIFALQRLIQKHKPSIIFLSEMMVKDWNFMNVLRHRLGFLNCESMWSEGISGCSGGLALFLKDGLKIYFLNKNKHYIDVVVHPEEDQAGQPWRLLGFYGHPSTGSCHVSFDLHKNRGDVLQIPWVVIRDYNELLHSNEKRGGQVRTETQMQIFRSALAHCSLKVLEFSSEDNMATFWGHGFEERLDRATANTAWCNLFPRSVVHHLPRHGGDHAPLLLKVQEVVPKCRSRAKRFRFESFWADYNVRK